MVWKSTASRLLLYKLLRERLSPMTSPHFCLYAKLGQCRPSHSTAILLGLGVAVVIVVEVAAVLLV
jgi:hypothetical protein